MFCFQAFYIAIFTLSAVRGSVPNEDDIYGSPIEQLTPLTPFKPATFSQRQPTEPQPRAVISGLLVSRQACQDPGYGVCPNFNHCCPIGGQCCNSGIYIRLDDSLTSFRSKAALREIGVTVQAAAAIQRMAATTKVVVNAERRFVVKVEHAVPWGGIVQRKGVVPTERFAVALRANRDSNNVGRCRSGGGSGNTPTVKPTTTHPTRATTHEQPDTTPHEPAPTTTPPNQRLPPPTNQRLPPLTFRLPQAVRIGSSLSTTSTTRSGPTTVPSATAGSENIIIDVSSNTNITWLGPWADVTSSCSSSRKAKACHSTGSDNFNTVKMEYNFTGTSVYVSIASDSARFSISIDGEVTDYGSASTASGAETPGNCTFGWSQTNLTPGTPHVLEIILFGSTEDSMRRAPAAPAPFTLEIQNFVITQNDTTAAAAGGSNAASMTRGFGSDVVGRSLGTFRQKLCNYAWDFNLNTNPSWFCAAHGLTLGSIATPVISDFGFPKAVHLDWESPLICPGQHATELMCGIRKR
ncbi:hypothetical protein B0H14DRAFT_2622273 [Mycena olivaceomarginata]|nr:hypothetical protein B0H14DRAFT_2622273 [Mycena olivaceomarginata]